MRNLSLFILVLFFGIACAQDFSDKGRGFEIPTQEKIMKSKKLKANFMGAGNDLYEMTVQTYGDASASHFDLRDINGVTPVRDEGGCGSCWAFSAAAAIESNYALKNKKQIDLSEQGILGCSGAGNCVFGGWYTQVFSWLMDDSTSYLTLENNFPYIGQDYCQTNTNSVDIKVTNYGMIDTGSVSAIKEALVKYGAVSAALYSNNADFIGYTTGVIRGNNDSGPDHAITIIGWDDDLQAWLIKNSWSEYWGDKGYAWVGYDACNISYGSWVDLSAEDNASPETITENKIILNFIDELGKSQTYQDIYVKIDEQPPFHFYMNEQQKEYHNYVPVDKGSHKIQIITKSIIEKNGKNSMIFGVLKGDIEVDENKDYKLKYDKVIKNNVFNLSIK